MRQIKRLVFTIAVGIVTITAVVVFVRTLEVAAISVPNSGTIEVEQIKDLSISAIYDGASEQFRLNKMLSGSSTQISDHEILAQNQPVMLSVPAVQIRANIQQVGRKADGSMGTPSNFRDVGWYAYGTVPGNMGSAVIDGHVDDGLGLAGVFKNLENVEIGDHIFVDMSDGQKMDFVVIASEWFDYSDAPNEEIFQENDARYIKLITCGGSWVKSDKTYDQRLVVKGVLVK